MPTVGVDALRWFWTARTPEETGAELSRLVTEYTALWGVRSVVLIGYSFGADVLPEAFAAMTPEARVTAGITEGLLRLSVGLEHQDDIIADLTRALDALVPADSAVAA